MAITMAEPDPHGTGYERDLARLAALSGAGLASAVLFLAWPGLDLLAAGLFADGVSGFPFKRAAALRFLNGLTHNLTLATAAFVLLGLYVTFGLKRPLLGLGRRHYGFLALTLVTGPLIIANVLFKDQWGRARPREISQFGGEAIFTPPLVPANQCAGNCSFVSGDAAFAFWTVALALLIPWRRTLWVKLALGFGVLIGLGRMAQGAHFLSDVIFAAVFVLLTVILVKLIVLDRRWGIAAAVERRARSAREPARRAGEAVMRHVGAPLAWWSQHKGRALAEALNLVHDDDMAERRADLFRVMNRKGLRGRLWLFFRSRPEDFERIEEDARDDGAEEPPPN